MYDIPYAQCEGSPYYNTWHKPHDAIVICARTAIMFLMPDTQRHSHSEKRHWVRVNRTCNNRCIFCLDNDYLDGSMLDLPEIADDLKAGVSRGARRVIISGGEPTIHPHFIEIIEIASALGYVWVQAISNGRMFFYKNFLQQAVDAGLKEITFSMHGHTPELFDRLTGIKGSFKQALNGLRNALSVRGLIVSIDIVINRLNHEQLPDIVRFYRKLGVAEYDLLYLVPFGGAWKNRERLVPDPAQVMPSLHRTLDLAAPMGLTLWTNRVPPPMLEGYEKHIQSPSKLHDEIFGRRQMFADFLESGTLPSCRDERCAFCTMEDFCGFLDSLRTMRDGRAPRDFFVAPDESQLLERCDVSRIRRVITDPRTAAACKTFLSDHNIPFSIVFETIPDIHDIPEVTGAEMIIAINRHTAPGLLAHGLPDLGDRAPHFVAPTYGSLEQSLANATSLKTFFKHYLSDYGPSRGNIYNTMPCFSESDFRPLQALPLFLAAPDLKWNLEIVTDSFITREYFQHSYRCRECASYENCPGLHINYARTYGFGEARPHSGKTAAPGF